MPTKDFSKFSPRAYLEEFYTQICDEYEHVFLLAFYHEAYMSLPDDVKVVEVGGGPTIYPLISASIKAESITFSDYKKENIREVEKWVHNRADAFDWDDYFRLALATEGTAVTDQNLSDIKKRLRSKIKKFVLCDVFKSNPFTPNKIGPFDVVSTNFCPESITDNEADFTKAVKNIISQLKPKGKLIMTLLRNAKHYTVNNKKFSCFSIDEKGIELVLKKQGMFQIDIRSIPVYIDGFDDEYDGLMLVTAIKI